MAVQRIGHCVAVSRDDARDLQELAPTARLYVVPNGTDTNVEPPPPASDAHRALWVGGMNDPYNRRAVLFFLKEIFPLVRELCPQFVWRVVGKSPPPELVAAAAAIPEIELAGFVHDLKAEYATANVVVVPLTAGGGTKLKTLEAMSMGRAVVCTSIGAEGIDAHHGEHLLIADEPREFAAHLARLFADRQRVLQIGDAARRLMQAMYDWRIVQGKMLDAVNSAMTGQSGSA